MDVTAGWYPDPEDAASLRWWDGAAWTDHRQPLAGAAPEGGGDRSTKKRPVIIVGVIAVVALIAGGAFLLLGGGEDSDYTWEGDNIADLQATLDEADEVFLDGVDERSGSVTDDSRCYMVQSADDDAERASDVFDFMRCGPVLFVDNDPDDGVWITYALDAAEEDGDIVLTVADQPQTSQPSRYDADDEKISRPDGARPPEGDGGVEAPDVPAAEPGVFVAQDPSLDDLELDYAYLRAVGLSKSVTVSGIGEPSRFGSGDSARTHADDERFIAFELAQDGGDSRYGTSAEQSDRLAASSATVSLDVDGEQTALFEDDNDSGTGRFLISVPESAEDVDIVLVDSDVTQRVSLLDRAPGSGNIEVLARDSREVEIAAVHPFPVIITHPDGSVQNDTFTVTIEAAELLYYVDEASGLVPSGPDKAFLVIHHFVTSEATGITQADAIALEPGHLHLETAGGTVVEAVNLAPNAGDLLIGFEVSGGFEGATLSISGSATSGDVIIDVGQPNLRIPIEIENV